MTVTPDTKTIPVLDLVALAEESATGRSATSTIDIVGEEYGGHVLITGGVKTSTAFPGFVTVETEVGTLLLDVDGEVTYQENAA